MAVDHARANHSASLRTRAAAIVSAVFHPVIIPLPVFVLLALPLMREDLWAGLRDAGIALLFAVVAVALAMLVLRAFGRISSFDVHEHRERVLPLFVAGLVYFTGFLFARELDVLPSISALLFCYATNTVIVALISRYWKISIHTTATAGPLVALAMAYGPAAASGLLIVPVIAVSRVILRRHTCAQVITGAALGAGSTWLQILLLF
jgi:membrane-associated phospholipid phosphatase